MQEAILAVIQMHWLTDAVPLKPNWCVCVVNTSARWSLHQHSIQAQADKQVTQGLVGWWSFPSAVWQRSTAPTNDKRLQVFTAQREISIANKLLNETTGSITVVQ